MAPGQSAPHSKGEGEQGGGILLFQKMQKYLETNGVQKERSFVQIKIIMGPSGKTTDLLLKQVPK